jgi:hypothetical protein
MQDKYRDRKPILMYVLKKEAALLGICCAHIILLYYRQW